MAAFGKLVDQKVMFTTPSIWYPKADIGVVKNKMWVDEGGNQ